MALDDDDVREILRLIDASDLEELRIETPGLSLHVRRGGAPVTPSPDAPPPPRVDPPAAPAAPVAPAADALVAIASPMLGTFYRAEAPGSRPFVEVGDHLEVGSVVCLIEVMKLMNHVVSEVAGTVAEICVEDGALVEFEQTLVRVTPST